MQVTMMLKSSLMMGLLSSRVFKKEVEKRSRRKTADMKKRVAKGAEEEELFRTSQLSREARHSSMAEKRPAPMVSINS
jgi:hypothetical protein